MKSKEEKEGTSRLEESGCLCVSPKVIAKVSPEDVNVAVLRHLYTKETEVLEVNERDATDRHSLLRTCGERRSVHQSSGGIAFCVTSEAEEPFYISVALP